MPLTADIVGMHYRYPDYYEVEREKIREYSVAVQNGDAWYSEEGAAAELGYKGVLAPLTFCCVFGYQAQTAFFKYAHVAVEDAQIVQVDQVLKYFKPLVAGQRWIAAGLFEAAERDVLTTAWAPPAYSKIAEVVASTPVNAGVDLAVITSGLPSTMCANEIG